MCGACAQTPHRDALKRVCSSVRRGYLSVSGYAGACVVCAFLSEYFFFSLITPKNPEEMEQ